MSAKPLFASLMLLILPLVVLLSFAGLLLSGFSLAWSGAALVASATLGLLIFSSFATLKRYHLLILYAACLLSLVFSIYGSFYGDSVQRPVALTCTVLVIVLWMLYDLWYSPIDRSQSNVVLGQPLPQVNWTTMQGNYVFSTDLSGLSLLVFYRGRWCPMCVTQIREVAKQYRLLQNYGVNTYLIGSQPVAETMRLAAKFDAPLNFLVDEDNESARALGLEHLNGVPKGLGKKYGDHTVLPTVVLLDEGRVIFAHQTDDYRLRPQPNTFLAIIEKYRSRQRFAAATAPA